MDFSARILLSCFTALFLPQVIARSECDLHLDPNTVPAGYTVIAYNASQEHVENPHRGFVSHIGTHSSHHVPLSISKLDRLRHQNGITMIRRNFILDTFVTSSISDDYLDKIRHDMEMLDSARFTSVLHFSYVFHSTDHPPYGDASKDIVLHHISQLTPIFRQYERVITSIEAGFIGFWGEWHHSDHFGNSNYHGSGHDPLTGLTPSELQDRKDVLLALLHAAPSSVQVQLRYPRFKLSFMGSNPADIQCVEAREDRCRTGHHNACFVSNDNDVGTYHNKAVEYPFLEQDTRYMIMGGETCRLTQNHRHECSTALREMSMFHWTYLNQGYNKDVLNVWKQQGCYEEVHRRLGYRLVVKKAIVPLSVPAGQNLLFSLQFENTGFHAPVKDFNLSIVLASTSGPEYFAARVADVDLRDWQPGYTHNVTSAVHVTSDIPQGQYKLLLCVSDPTAADQSDHNVLLASVGVPLYDRGLNDLGHLVTVTGEGDSSAGCHANSSVLSPWTAPPQGRYSRLFQGTWQ